LSASRDPRDLRCAPIEIDVDCCLIFKDRGDREDPPGCHPATALAAAV